MVGEWKVIAGTWKLATKPHISYEYWTFWYLNVQYLVRDRSKCPKIYKTKNKITNSTQYYIQWIRISMENEKIECWKDGININYIKYKWNDFLLFSDRKILLFTDIVITIKLMLWTNNKQSTNHWTNQPTNRPNIQTAHQNHNENIFNYLYLFYLSGLLVNINVSGIILHELYFGHNEIKIIKIISDENQ